MKVNDILKIEIIDDNHNGNGIGKIDDYTLFVPGTLKGDIVLAKVKLIKKKLVFLELDSFIEKGSLHQEVLCPYYDVCGGCDLIHTSFLRENELKKKYMERLFNRSNIDIVSYDRFSYRNKVTLHVLNGKLGFYKKNSNDLVEIDSCLLLDEEINKFIEVFKKIDLSDITEIVIKKCNEGILLSFSGLVKQFDLDYLSSFNNVCSIYINNHLKYGNLYGTKSMNNILFNINGNSFFQVNDKCAISMYDKIKEYVGTCDRLLDLYCGTASIGIYLSDVCRSVVGVEINKDSVLCAKENIKNNNINNYEIILSDASVMEDSFDVVVVDPPRAGLSKKVISNLKKIGSKRIVYVSCNPSTLKRDIELLDDYVLKKICSFNMFPGTCHVETVCLLSRR